MSHVTLVGGVHESCDISGWSHESCDISGWGP